MPWKERWISSQSLQPGGVEIDMPDTFPVPRIHQMDHVISGMNPEGI